MKSAYEIALGLVESFEQPKSMSQTMEQTNSYYTQIKPNNWDKPFLSKDIQFVKFFELMNMTDREKDLLYVANSFHPAYVTLHVTILTLKEHPHPYSLNELQRVFETMKRLNSEHILLDDKIGKNEFNLLIEGLQ